MQVTKKGLIYGPDGKSDWACHSALQPTPLLLDPDTIRVFVGMRDGNGVSRVGFVDVSAHNPRSVLRVCERPALDTGIPGAFDENGVVPCAVIEVQDRLYLYYAGYQLGRKVRFYVFSGLAVSDDRGISFQRVTHVPITDRTDEGMFFRVIHSIICENGRWRVWYGAGSVFDSGVQKSLPRYDVYYMESDSFLTFPTRGKVAVKAVGDEHRIGRPFVFRTHGPFFMFYGIGTEATPYRLGYAVSHNGTDWERKDDLDLEFSARGWDSEMIAYPAVIRAQGNIFLFYNGNSYGRDGFGYAVLKNPAFTSAG